MKALRLCAILPALFTFWIAGRALSQVAKAERLMAAI